MSYNINTWKTKKLDNFIIPMVEIRKLPYVDVDLDEDGNVEISGVSEMFEIIGNLKNKKVHVATICYAGEGSGSTWDDLKKCFESSTGELIATQIWKEGDSITRLVVKDGNVTEENIEL
jgi:hypothetical protein